MLIEKYLKIGISTFVIVMMVVLAWSVLDDKKVRDKMHANSLIKEQVKTLADKTVKVSKGIFTSSDEAKADMAKENIEEEITTDIVKSKASKPIKKKVKQAVKPEEKLVPTGKKLGMMWIVKPAVKVANLKISNNEKVVTNG